MVLSPVLAKLQHKRVVLASASPRRRDILGNAGLRFEVVPSRFKETLSKASFPSPYAYAIETAKQKALEVVKRMHQKDLQTPDVVIGADTIVAIGGLILEKPVDKQDAYRMLSRLSGDEHSVFTGVAILRCSSQGGRLDTEVSEFYEETRVKFSELSEEMLWEYIHTGEPLDKAGGYGIQGLGGMLVEYIRGDFLNVMGFPLNHFCKKLAELYCPPLPEGLRRVRNDPGPSVDTFENLSDLEGGGSEPARRDAGGPCFLRADKCRSEATGDPEAHCKETVDTRPPFPAGLMGLIDGFKASKALFTACKLKVFDLLRDEAPQSAAQVASKVDASVCAAGRLLDVCTALGLLEKSERGYRNTELANVHLVTDGEYSIHGYITHCDDHTWDLFTHLEFAVKVGRDQSHGALGKKDSHAQSQTSLQSLKATHDLTKLTAHRVATAFDLSQFTSACHLGGSTGALAQELAREYPQLKVTVFDLPEVIEHVPSFRLHGEETARVSFVPGDVFRDRLPEADLYVLSRIPHDWPDDKVQRWLQRVASACQPGGGLLLAEAVLEEARRASPGGLRHALTLLVQTEGRERSSGECRRLLQQHGFGDLRVASSGDFPDVILGTRVGP